MLSTEGQRRLKGATALVSRAGGMGGPAAQALVMAGVGRVIIAHGGDVISADLNRQVLGSEDILGKPRAPHFCGWLNRQNCSMTAMARPGRGCSSTHTGKTGPCGVVGSAVG